MVSLATDASSCKSGAVVGLQEKEEAVTLGNFWDRGDNRPIHLKEAEALCSTLAALGSRIAGHRVDAVVDNMVVVHAWGKRGCKDLGLALVLKFIFSVVTELNVDLNVTYIPTAENPVDAPSHEL